MVIDAKLQAFREEVVAFCARELPDELRERVARNQILEKEDYVFWQKRLHVRGWFGGHWPEAYGGLGWSKLQQWIFEEALYSADAPWLIPFGRIYVGPIVYTFGNEEQKRRFLPGILNSDVWWCQGFSEPNAGSDLASLITRARRNGDHYVLSGQKIWTTMAQWADMIFVLARTSSEGKPQSGISFLLVDMKSPGVTVNPVETIDGVHHLNEVFFDDVRVPIENLVGEENHGWSYTKFLLTHERFLVAEISKSRRMIRELYALVQNAGDGSLLRDPYWRLKLAELEVDATALEALCEDFLEAFEDGNDPGVEVSYLKILGSELAQKISGVSMDVLGRYGLSYQCDALRPNFPEFGPRGAAGITREYLHGRATTIYGGSNEIQRNIIAKGALGL